MKAAIVDFVISAGPACRPAYHAQKRGMRMFASPCDWMMHYSLMDFIDNLEQDAEDMFKVAHIEKDGNLSYVIDEKSGMVSLHHFYHEQSLDWQIPLFSKKMKKRAINTYNCINNSRSVGILMNRNIEKEELIRFAERLCQVFCSTTFHILNIRDIKQEEIKVEYEIKENRYIIHEISFNDEHKLGKDPNINPDFWLGNVQLWARAISMKFKLSQYSVVNNRLLQQISTVSDKLSSEVNNRILQQISTVSDKLSALDEKAQQLTTHTSSCIEMLRSVAVIQQIPSLKWKLHYYRFMSHITWGRKKAHYKNKRRLINNIMEKLRSLELLI
ncbi:MAG: hypothetical protein Q4F35_01455 [Akkermansia sp.]|nr:hypothetical protein [Akkermansia sp.]